MKVIEAINEVDKLKPNMYGLAEKIKWLSRLDKRIFEEILLTHVLSREEMEPFLPEEEETDPPADPTEAINALDLPHHWRRRPPVQLVFKGYTEEDTEAELLVGEPYDEMYVHWLEAQIDWNNMEYAGFNNTNAMFESVYSAFRNAFNQSHRPIGKKKRYF